MRQTSHWLCHQRQYAAHRGLKSFEMLDGYFLRLWFWYWINLYRFKWHERRRDLSWWWCAGVCLCIHRYELKRTSTTVWCHTDRRLVQGLKNRYWHGWFSLKVKMCRIYLLLLLLRNGLPKKSKVSLFIPCHSKPQTSDYNSRCIPYILCERKRLQTFTSQSSSEKAFPSVFGSKWLIRCRKRPSVVFCVSREALEDLLFLCLYCLYGSWQTLWCVLCIDSFF